jgi:hypothetical protein
MRDGFDAIVDDWFRDDMVELGKRLLSAGNWLRANGGLARAEFDEQMTLDLMVKRQTLLVARAGAFAPFLRADLNDHAIVKALYDDDPS